MPGDMPNRDVLSEKVFPDLYESGIPDLQKGLELGHFTSVDLIKVSDY
jgi:amidase